MNDEQLQERKKELIQGLFVTKEDTLREFESIILLSKKYMKIEPETGQIIFNKEASLNLKNKIILILISQFMLKEAEVSESDKLNINEISAKIKKPKTTISKPLGILIDESIISKDSELNYFIVHYQIKNLLESIEK